MGDKLLSFRGWVESFQKKRSLFVYEKIFVHNQTSKNFKKSLYQPGQTLRFPEACGTHISGQSVQECGKIVSHKHPPPLPPGDIPGTHFLFEAEWTQGP
jgi:hypothetical protein